MRVIQKLLMVGMIVLLSACASRRQQMNSSDIDWVKRAEQVSIGMTRAEVDKILPMWDGSVGSLLTAPCITTTTGAGSVAVYWVSRDWRVAVHYDGFGGEDSKSNRVRKPVEVEKDRYGSAKK